MFFQLLSITTNFLCFQFHFRSPTCPECGAVGEATGRVFVDIGKEDMDSDSGEDGDIELENESEEEVDYGMQHENEQEINNGNYNSNAAPTTFLCHIIYVRFFPIFLIL